MTMQAPPATRGLSIAALVTGIIAFFLGLVPFLGVLIGAAAITLGVIALRKRAPKPMPIIGIVAGSLAAITSLIMSVVVFNLPAPTPQAEPPAVTQEAEPTPEPTQEPATLPAVPDTTGQDGATARDRLEAAGYEVAFDAGADTVVMASNWTVNAYTPTEAEPGATITLTVTKPEATTPPQEATTGGLTATYAQSACTQAIDAEFPYGTDQHWIMGKLAEELRTDTDEWYFKVTVDVTNAYGATQDGVNVECYVSGSNATPTVAPLVYY